MKKNRYRVVVVGEYKIYFSNPKHLLSACLACPQVHCDRRILGERSLQELCIELSNNLDEFIIKYEHYTGNSR